MAQPTTTAVPPRREDIAPLLDSMGEFAPEVAAAVRAVMAAAEYDDPVLTASYLAEAREAFVRGAAGFVGGRIRRADDFLTFCRSTVERLGPVPIAPSLDALGRSLRAGFADVQRQLADVRSSRMVGLLEGTDGREVVERLDATMAEVAALKRSMVDGWPWSDGPLPPVNRAMVEESRRLTTAGDPGIPVRDLIRQMEAEGE